MKNTLKKQLRDLLSGNEDKQDILIVTDNGETPGFYKFRDKLISRKELDELSKGYEKTIVLTRHKRVINH